MSLFKILSNEEISEDYVIDPVPNTLLQEGMIDDVLEKEQLVNDNLEESTEVKTTLENMLLFKDNVLAKGTACKADCNLAIESLIYTNECIEQKELSYTNVPSKVNFKYLEKCTNLKITEQHKKLLDIYTSMLDNIKSLLEETKCFKDDILPKLERELDEDIVDLKTIIEEVYDKGNSNLPYNDVIVNIMDIPLNTISVSTATHIASSYSKDITKLEEVDNSIQIIAECFKDNYYLRLNTVNNNNRTYEELPSLKAIFDSIISKKYIQELYDVSNRCITTYEDISKELGCYLECEDKVNGLKGIVNSTGYLDTPITYYNALRMVLNELIVVTKFIYSLK